MLHFSLIYLLDLYRKQHYFLNTDDVVRKYIVSETSPCNRIVKRKIFIDNNVRFLVNKIYEDLATIPTLAKYTKKIGYIPDRVYDYVIRENSTMRYTTYNPKIEDIFYAVEKLYNDFKQIVRNGNKWYKCISQTESDG